MDPFSITTGVIAVVGVIEQAAKCVQRLRAIHQAPCEVNLLLDEVADLWAVLQQVETARRTPANREILFEYETPASSLDRLIARTSTKLRELDSLLQHHLSRTQRRAPDWSWLRGRQKAATLRADLTTLRLNIAAALAATTSKTVNRVESSVNGFHADQIKSNQLLTFIISGLGLDLPPASSAVKIDRERHDINITLQSPVQTRKADIPHPTQSWPQPAKMTRHIPDALEPSQTPVASESLQTQGQKKNVSWASSLWRHGLDGNIRAIQDLFSQNFASPLDVQGLGGSVLHYAADHNHWDLCKFLIGQGARLDSEDDFHNTPTSLAWEKVLSGALTEDEGSMVASMFANTDFLQTRQFSVLHKIVLHLIPRTIEPELAYSTRDLNAVDSSGRTALAWAAARGGELALTTLIGYDADINLPDSQGNTSLHHAQNVACIDHLLNAGADRSCQNIFGFTPLHMVCRGTGSLPVLKHLINAGIPIDAVDKRGETALANATYNKHVECAFHLVHSGADINIANGRQGAPIHVALISDRPAILLLLLNAGADFQQTNGFGRTILHYAAGHVSVQTVEILTAHGLAGIDIDARDLDGKTAENLLGDRVDDNNDPLFKARFREMLASIRDTQDSMSITMPELPELTIEIKGSTGLTKAEPVENLKPELCDEDEIYDYEYDTQNATVLFDAMEEIQQGLQVVDIAA
ncbi:MAG: hypothetical protein Q9222_000955 [Ikaeria aurantiellina]